MAKASLLVLKVLILLLCFGWLSLWLLKPTQLWTKKWHGAEESASTTVFSYNGTDFVFFQKLSEEIKKKFPFLPLTRKKYHMEFFVGLDFAVYTFPVIAVAIIGFVYLELKPREPRSRYKHTQM